MDFLYDTIDDIPDPGAFAATVVGESMEPNYRDGEIVIFSPAREPRDGDDCFIRFAVTGECSFKRVRFDGVNVHLQPMNPKFPVRIVPCGDITAIYVAVRLISIRDL